MLRKIGFTLLCAVSIFSSNVFSIPVHSLQPGLTIEYDLPAKEPQIFVNYMFWAIEANCKITSQDATDDVLFEAISRKGKVNDVILIEGQSMSISVVNGQNIKINADSGAKVKITNMGEHLIKATCTA